MGKWDDAGRSAPPGKHMPVDPEVMRALERKPAHQPDTPQFSWERKKDKSELKFFGRRLEGGSAVEIGAPDPLDPPPLPESLSGPVHADGSIPAGPLPHPMRAHLRRIDDPALNDPWAEQRQANAEVETPSRRRGLFGRTKQAGDDGAQPLWQDYARGHR